VVEVASPVQQWFIDQIETFAPAAWYAERQQLYAELLALEPSQESSRDGDICLFILAQIVAAFQLTSSAASRSPRGRNPHETWYSKERQRIVKLLQQITESPVVASFQAKVRYYAAEEVTCPHGRNQKTCEALYALGVTLQLLQRHPPSPGVRKHVERLRHLTPHLPPLHDLCMPQAVDETMAESTGLLTEVAETPERLADERVLYLLGTVVSRLRQAGLTVEQSCACVDRIVSWCFGHPDPSGTRPTLLAEQWRRLW
jgi:hypothetical protein